MEPIEIYAQIQTLVKKEIDDKIATYANNSRYNVVPIPAHTHNGVDSSRIDVEDLIGNLTGNYLKSSGKGTSLPAASDNTDGFYYLTTTDTLYRSNGTAWIALN